MDARGFYYGVDFGHQHGQITPCDRLGQSRECGDGSDSEHGTFRLDEHGGSESPMLAVPHTGLSSAAYCEQCPEEPKSVGSLSWQCSKVLY